MKIKRKIKWVEFRNGSDVIKFKLRAGEECVERATRAGINLGSRLCDDGTSFSADYNGVYGRCDFKSN